MRSVVCLVVLAACGRIGFDAASDADVRRDSACTTCDQGLVAYWPLDDVATGTGRDIIGGHDVTFMATFTAGTGVHGGAAELMAGYATVSWDLPSALAGSFTIALWARPSAATSGFDRYFSMFYFDTADHGVLILDNDASGNGLRCGVYIGGSWFYITQDNVYAPTGWRHIACTYDGSTVITYANGGEANRRSQVSGVVGKTATIPVAIGASIYPNDTAQNMWSGSIDDVRVYDRALTAAELALLATP